MKRRLFRGRRRPPPQRRKRRGQRNWLETQYALHLDRRKAAGEILWWRFEPFTLRIGAGARYTPDFAVQLPDGVIELHETKGHWREAARVRIKVAADLYPFRFLCVKARTSERKIAGVRHYKIEEWLYEEIGEETVGSETVGSETVGSD